MADVESLSDVCVSSTTSGRLKQQKKEVFTENNNEESYTDYLCPICLQILIEPVVMPCKHELCKPCFKQNVEEANLQCPLCRIRISSWARMQTRNGTLVNRKRWEEIQRLFPDRCAKRLRGEDDDDFGIPPAKRVLSTSGEVYREYEFEMNKIRQAREEEMKASEEVIRKLEEEEQMLKQKAEQQARQDEDLAKRIQQEERQQHVSSSQEQRKSSQEHATGNSTGKGKSLKSKKTTGKQGPSNTRTLDRWFSPTSKPSNSTRNGTVSVESAAGSRNNTTLSPEDLYSTRVEEFRQKQSQERSDRELAMELQRQFDIEARKQHEVERKRGTEDAYKLRSELFNQSDCKDS